MNTLFETKYYLSILSVDINNGPSSYLLWPSPQKVWNDLYMQHR